MPITALTYLALYFGGLLAALVRHPMWGLYAYFLAFYLHPPSRWWAASVPELRWSYIAAIVACASLWIHRSATADDRPSWLRSPIAVPLVLYAAWMWIQSAWAVDPTTHLEGTLLMSKYLVVFYLIYRLATDADAIRKILLVHVIGCFFFGWLALTIDVSGRLDGIGGPGINNANTLGMHLATGLVVAGTFVLLGNGWWRWACVLMVPFIVNGVILTGSRGAFLGVAAGGVAIWYLRPRIRKRLFYGLAVLAGIGFLWLAQEEYWERMGTIESAVVQPSKVDTSTEIRLALIDAQWEMAKDYPFGAGFRGTATLSPRYLSEEFLTSADGEDAEGAARSSHNTLMSVVVEQGIVGVVVYFWLLIVVVREVLRQRRRLINTSIDYATHVTAIGAILVVVFVAGIFTDYLMAEVQFWCLPLLASIAAIKRVPNAAESHGPGGAAVEASAKRPQLAPGRAQ